MSIEAMKQALEALWVIAGTKQADEAITALRTAIEQAEKQEPYRVEQDLYGEEIKLYTTPPEAPVQEPVKLWLWKNFVDGKPEYWAFDNPFPCVSVGGDPLTLGEPCGWALLKHSVNGRPDRSEQEVINTVTRLATPPAAQRQWVGLTEEEHTQIAVDAGCMSSDWVFYGAAVERALKKKNT